MRSIVLGFALLALAVTTACGSSDSDDPKEETGDDCLERCQAVAANCSLDAADCPALCQHVTEKELSCMETTNCDAAAYDACVNPGGGEDVTQPQPDLVSGDDVSATQDIPTGACDGDCGFDYCDEVLGECVSCLEDGHCSTAYNGPVCLFKGTVDATCGCEDSGDCAGHPSGDVCHELLACSCGDDFACTLSDQGTKCVSVMPAVGLSQCGCEDEAMDCPVGMTCLASKCM